MMQEPIQGQTTPARSTKRKLGSKQKPHRFVPVQRFLPEARKCRYCLRPCPVTSRSNGIRSVVCILAANSWCLSQTIEFPVFLRNVGTRHGSFMQVCQALAATRKALA